MSPSKPVVRPQPQPGIEGRGENQDASNKRDSEAGRNLAKQVPSYQILSSHRCRRRIRVTDVMAVAPPQPARPNKYCTALSTIKLKLKTRQHKIVRSYMNLLQVDSEQVGVGIYVSNRDTSAQKALIVGSTSDQLIGTRFTLVISYTHASCLLHQPVDIGHHTVSLFYF